MISLNTSTSHRPAVLRGQDGFTMIVTIGVMLITSLLLIATLTAADGEIHLTSTDTAQKRAYYAAQAGIDDYEYHLTQDGNYLSYCTEPPTTNPALNQVGETTHRATVPSTNGEATNEKYAIQLLPAESDVLPSDHKCDRTHLVETMLEEQGPATGTFRIESTGYSSGQERTLVATFRNANFVSYVWYTKFETGDPSVHGPIPEKDPSTWWTECGQFYGERPGRCSVFNNYFGTGESINGPMHTEDHVGVCGQVGNQPVFGRNLNDRIEFRHKVGVDTGYSNEGCGVAEPTFKGDHILPEEVPSISPPPGDEELAHIVESAYEYKGKTEIVLEGSTMSVSKWEETSGEKGEKIWVKKTTSGVAYPPNGVIYVSGGCSESYSPFGPKPLYSADYACGNVYVHGNYTNSLTIASENDIIINGNITTPLEGKAPSTNSMLGLIANNFVRVYHPLAGKREAAEYRKCGSAANQETEVNKEPADLKEPEIYAAILAVKHSFIVDNFDCGKPTLGHLNVYGAIAGLFTDGMTGVINGGTLVNGYSYNLQYDNRLQVEEPPHFLNPIQAAWYVQRQSTAPNP